LVGISGTNSGAQPYHGRRCVLSFAWLRTLAARIDLFAPQDLVN